MAWKKGHESVIKRWPRKPAQTAKRFMRYPKERSRAGKDEIREQHCGTESWEVNKINHPRTNYVRNHQAQDRARQGESLNTNKARPRVLRSDRANSGWQTKDAGDELPGLKLLRRNKGLRIHPD